MSRITDNYRQLPATFNKQPVFCRGLYTYSVQLSPINANRTILLISINFGHEKVMENRCWKI